MAEAPSSEDVFLREVDDELRRDQLISFWDQWKYYIIGGVGGGLALLAGGMWWVEHRAAVAGAVGDQYEKGLAAFAGNKAAEGKKAFDTVIADSNPGYRALALMTQAAAAAEKNDLKTAGQLYAKVAQDSDVLQPTRDLALIRQTHAEMDMLKPQDVVSRLTPIAVKGNPWFGHAGEMLAIAKMKMGNKAEAGKIFAAMYKDETVPEGIRSRAVQMASVLGVDVSDADKISGDKKAK